MENDSKMQTLTFNEMKFVEYVTSGENFTEAYILAYGASRQRTRASLSVAGSQIKMRPHVTAAIQTVREAGVEQAAYSVANHIGELQRLKREALEAKNFGAAVRAEELTGKVAGFYTERREITFKSSADNLLIDLSKVFGVEFAEMAAKKLGVEFAPINRVSKLVDVTD